jgi:hypothetical protein
MPEDNILVVNEPKQNVIVSEKDEPIIAVVNIGTPGKEGPAGTGDKYFKFTQGSASAEWKIVHNLNKNPSITVQDSANENVEGFCEYINANELILKFSAAFGGTAYLN